MAARATRCCDTIPTRSTALPGSPLLVLTRGSGDPHCALWAVCRLNLFIAFMLDLILAKKYSKPSALPVPLQWSILVFPRPHRGPFLRDSILLFGSVGELTISQNH